MPVRPPSGAPTLIAGTPFARIPTSRLVRHPSDPRARRGAGRVLLLRATGASARPGFRACCQTRCQTGFKRLAASGPLLLVRKVYELEMEGDNRVDRRGTTRRCAGVQAALGPPLHVRVVDGGQPGS